MEILQLITEYGLGTVIIGVLTTFSTGLIKLPIKHFAKKLKDSTIITRFIVFLPVALSFALTLAYTAILHKPITIDSEFVNVWLTSGGLSLTIYAFYEKLFPSKKKILKDSEIEANRQLIEDIKALTKNKEKEAENFAEADMAIANEIVERRKRFVESGFKQNKQDKPEKIILGRHKDEETETEE